MPNTTMRNLVLAIVALTLLTGCAATGGGGLFFMRPDDSGEGQRYIIIAALPEETAGLEALAPVVFTGVGKVRATIAMYDAILQYQPDLIINYGTSGSISGITGLNKIDTFVERDMDTRPLGDPRGIPFGSGESLPEAEGVVLGTGDNFVSDPAAAVEGLDIRIDLVDMEGWALDRVAQHLGVRFVSYKYVSDSANGESGDDWQNNVAKGADLMKTILQRDYGVSSLK